MKSLRSLAAPEVLIKVIAEEIGRSSSGPKRRRTIHPIERVFIAVPVPLFDRHAADHWKKSTLASSTAREIGLEKSGYSLMQMFGQNPVWQDNASENRPHRIPKPLRRMDVQCVDVLVKNQVWQPIVEVGKFARGLGRYREKYDMRPGYLDRVSIR